MEEKRAVRPEGPDNPESLLDRYARGERDLSRMNLGGASLASVNLEGANLSRTNFGGANLQGAKLSRTDLTGAKLTGARLEGASLVRANLGGANLNGADLSGADLTGAKLTGAKLVNAKLDHARLDGAILVGAQIVRARLAGASFAAADLRGVNFAHSNLTGTTFGGARLAYALLIDIDLHPLCDANPPVMHQAPSTVDYRSIIKSIGKAHPNLESFLQRTGMPESFIDYNIDCARSIKTKVLSMLQSTFISYGNPDSNFAEQLNDALLRNGVNTFFFPKDAIPGKKLHSQMREGVNEYDRVILVCSKASLDRAGVLNEVNETLQREARDGGAAYLIPITLDDYVFGAWAPADPGVAQAVRDRVVADFREAKTDAAKFQEGLLRLVSALKK